MADRPPRMSSDGSAEVSWIEPMIVAIVAFVLANVLGNVVAAATNPKEADRKDQRDPEIGQFGERIGNWLIAAGAIAALVPAMA